MGHFFKTQPNQKNGKISTVEKKLISALFKSLILSAVCLVYSLFCLHVCRSA